MYLLNLLKEITLWRKAELNENRRPTDQFISSQLPNGNFKIQSAKVNGSTDSHNNSTVKPPRSDDAPSTAPELQEAPEAAF